MIRHYDLASCEMIVDPPNEAEPSIWIAPNEPQPTLRMQTVDEALAIEPRVDFGMPADLLQADPLAFVETQG